MSSKLCLEIIQNTCVLRTKYTQSTDFTKKLNTLQSHGHYIYNIDASYDMNKSKKKITPQINKNNDTKPQNLMKKEYLESYNELKESIIKNQKNWEKEQSESK